MKQLGERRHYDGHYNHMNNIRCDILRAESALLSELTVFVGDFFCNYLTNEEKVKICEDYLTKSNSHQFVHYPMRYNEDSVTFARNFNDGFLIHLLRRDVLQKYIDTNEARQQLDASLMDEICERINTYILKPYSDEAFKAIRRYYYCGTYEYLKYDFEPVLNAFNDNTDFLEEMQRTFKELGDYKNALLGMTETDIADYVENLLTDTDSNINEVEELRNIPEYKDIVTKAVKDMYVPANYWRFLIANAKNIAENNPERLPILIDNIHYCTQIRKNGCFDRDLPLFEEALEVINDLIVPYLTEKDLADIHCKETPRFEKYLPKEVCVRYLTDLCEYMNKPKEYDDIEKA